MINPWYGLIPKDSYLSLLTLAHVWVHIQAKIGHGVIIEEVRVNSQRICICVHILLVIIEHLEEISVRIKEVPIITLVAGDHSVAFVSLNYWYLLFAICGGFEILIAHLKISS